MENITKSSIESNIYVQGNNESNVNGYAKSFPAIFKYSKNDILKDYNDKVYIDFFSGAGVLNYGHNNVHMKHEIIKFLDSDSPVHCLDMDTVMKLKFLEEFDKVILKPRDMNYKIQFTGPTGTNAVEAAIKLARKVTNRSKIVSFTNSFHGMTATSLALSASQEIKHNDIPSQDVIFFPYDGYMGAEIDTMDYISMMLKTKGSGNQLPAAIILETIQAEGGIKVASIEWLVKLTNFAKENGILLIVDDIQVGCGRSGDFFSFERAGISPDIILLSKSISGFGLPLALLLLKPELDVWKSGEHNGTFRANNLSLCTATKALDYWRDNVLIKDIKIKSDLIQNKLKECLDSCSHIVDVRGYGMIWGIEFTSCELAEMVSTILFEKGIIIETCGNTGQVVKILTPLTITMENLAIGLNKILDVVSKIDDSYSGINLN